MPTIVGSNLVIYINGIPYAPATSFQYSVDYGRKENRSIDQLLPVELTPGPIKVHGTIGFVKLHFDGGIEGSNIVPVIEHLTMEKYITIAIVDRVTGLIIFNVNQAVITNQNLNVTPKKILSGKFSFFAIGYQNELSITMP